MENAEELLHLYQKDAEAIDVIYKAIGARPWVVEYDEKGDIVSCKWPQLEGEGYVSEIRKGDSVELEAWLDHIHPDDRDMVVRSQEETVFDKTGYTKYDVEYRTVLSGYRVRWIHSVGNVIRREDGSPFRFIGLSIDITERKAKSRELDEQYEIVEALSRDYLNVFMIDLDKELVNIVKLDGYVTEGFGDKSKPNYSYTPFALKYINDRVYSEDQEELKVAMDINTVREKLKESDEYVYSYRCIDKGSIHFYQFTYIKLHSEKQGGKVIAGFKNIDAIVANAKERETLKILSETDIMSNVLNRGYGERMARDMIKTGKCGLFIMLDIDKFKNINDEFGHGTGDKVIKAVADCLKKTFRKSDIVFRLGGDEFAALAEGVKDRETADKLMERFFMDLDDLNVEELKGYPVCVSVGAELFGTDESADTQFDDIYRHIDKCVYISKETEGNKVTFYE